MYGITWGIERGIKLEKRCKSMKKSLLTSIAALTLLTSPVLAEYRDPNRFVDRLPTDCDDVRMMKNIKTGEMEYLFIQTCNRAGYSLFSRLNGVRKVKENVIYIPEQELGNYRNYRNQKISGYYCSMSPKNATGLIGGITPDLWSCTAKGWTPR